MNITKIAAHVLLVYAALLGILYGVQRNLMYFPNSFYVSPKEAGAGAFQEFSVKTQDGLELKGWYAPASGKPFTIVFFHGNADTLYKMHAVASPYTGAGYGYLLAEYRGYSGMPGSPSEQGFYDDARAYINALIASGVKENDIILAAHSMGTGVATQMAGEFHIRGLMLMAPYASAAEIAQNLFPLFPARYMVRDRYENDKKLPRIHSPLLIIHGDKDVLVPASQGRHLFALANEPKQFSSIPGGRHNDIFNDAAAVGLKWIRKMEGDRGSKGF